uniref:Uncharacterized protein n=1 Tax=Anopheles merus TaxID=30066 RepID=A0A182US36_ANOME
MLPTYQRVGGGGSGTAGTSVSVTNPLLGRRSFRSREKCLILLVLSTFGFVCFGGFFFLPDNFSADRVLKAYKQFQRAGPEIFIPAPPPAHGRTGEEDIHRQDDRVKLAEKIRKELPDDFLEKPDTGGGGEAGVGGEETEGGEQQQQQQQARDGAGAIDEPALQPGGVGVVAGPAIEGPAGVVQPPHQQHAPDQEEGQLQEVARGEKARAPAGLHFNASVGEDPDRAVREKRNKVKEGCERAAVGTREWGLGGTVINISA